MAAGWSINPLASDDATRQRRWNVTRACAADISGGRGAGDVAARPGDGDHAPAVGARRGRSSGNGDGRVLDRIAGVEDAKRARWPLTATRVSPGNVWVCSITGDARTRAPGPAASNPQSARAPARAC